MIEPFPRTSTHFSASRFLAYAALCPIPRESHQTSENVHPKYSQKYHRNPPVRAKKSESITLAGFSNPTRDPTPTRSPTLGWTLERNPRNGYWYRPCSCSIDTVPKTLTSLEQPRPAAELDTHYGRPSREVFFLVDPLFTPSVVVRAAPE